MILFLVDDVTPRWVYTLDFVFKLRGVKYGITSSVESFENSEKQKVNCSTSPTNTGLQWPCSDLLTHREILFPKVRKGDFEGIECLNVNGVSDMFASVFFVLTRMEEYMIQKRDSHGRFSSKDSYQWRFGWLEQCICDRWSEAIIKHIEKHYDTKIEIEKPIVHLIPTFDIDNAYAYLLKKGPRFWMSVLKDIVRFNGSRLRERRRVINRQQRDPYDTYSVIRQLAIDGYSVKMFWLVGEYAQFDRNISLDEKDHKLLITDMSEIAEIGIHPSYRSNTLLFQSKAELQALQAVVQDNQVVTISRQHFLKLELPQTYQNLLMLGIREDYTMGYADHVGFRNGTARKYRWFDLTKNADTHLMIRPFAYMDGTLNEYMKLSIPKAKEKINDLYAEVCQYGGDFIPLWHNETIGDYGIWKGWSQVFAHTMELQKMKNGK